MCLCLGGVVISCGLGGNFSLMVLAGEPEVNVKICKGAVYGSRFIFVFSFPYSHTTMYTPVFSMIAVAVQMVLGSEMRPPPFGVNAWHLVI